MANKKGGFLGKLLGAAAIAGTAAAISKLEKQAKEENKDILDVAKDRFDEIVKDTKSGEIVDKASDAVMKTVDDIKSGEFQENVKTKLNETIEDVKSGEIFNKASDVATNVKDGVVDLFDGKKEEATEEVVNNEEEAAEAIEEAIDEAEEAVSSQNEDQQL